MPDTSIITANVLHERDHRYNLYPSLDFVSAEFDLDDTEIDLASTTYGNPLLSEWDKRTLLAVWLDNIGAKDKYDYVIFDCSPATKIVSQNALVASQKYIVPVIPEDISSRGVTHVRHLVKTKIDDKLSFLKSNARVSDADTPGNYVPTTMLAGIAPFLVRHAGRAVSGYTNIHTEQLAALRKQWGADVLAKEAQYFTGIAEAVNAGWPVWNYSGQNAKPRVESMMRSICDELKVRIDQ